MGGKPGGGVWHYVCRSCGKKLDFGDVVLRDNKNDMPLYNYFYGGGGTGRESDPVRVQTIIGHECNEIAQLLITKNQDYGNSFADPVKVFSKADPEEQLNVRIDDKLKRIMNRGDKNITEDTELDLIGYLILKRVYRRMKQGGE